MDKQQTLIVWLQNAHALEEDLAKSLEQQLSAAGEEPDVEKRMRQHLAETREHADTVAECLRTLGASTSTTQDLLAKGAGMVSGLLNAPMNDTLARNLVMDYAMEHLEMGVYSTIIAAAEDAGEPAVITACQRILADEEAMAAWIYERIPRVVRTSAAVP